MSVRLLAAPLALGLLAPAHAVAAPVLPGDLHFETHRDAGGDATPGIATAALAITKSRPAKLLILAGTDAATTADMTQAGSVSLVVDADADGLADYRASTPARPMVEDVSYRTTMTTVDGAATDIRVDWLRIAEGYGVFVPWKESGWRTVSWSLTLDDGAGGRDAAPATGAYSLDIAKVLAPRPVRKLRVKRSRGSAVVRWRPVTTATRYRIRVKALPKGRAATLVSTTAAVRLRTLRGEAYRITVRAKGPVGTGPARSIRVVGR